MHHRTWRLRSESVHFATGSMAPTPTNLVVAYFPLDPRLSRTSIFFTDDRRRPQAGLRESARPQKLVEDDADRVLLVPCQFAECFVIEPDEHARAHLARLRRAR